MQQALPKLCPCRSSEPFVVNELLAAQTGLRTSPRKRLQSTFNFRCGKVKAALPVGEGKASGSFGMPSGGGNRRLASEQFAVSDTLLIMNGLELRRLHSLSHENVKKKWD